MKHAKFFFAALAGFVTTLSILSTPTDVKADYYYGNKCFTNINWCWVPPAPIGVGCWCPSPFGPIVGRVGF